MFRSLITLEVRKTLSTSLRQDRIRLCSSAKPIIRRKDKGDRDQSTPFVDRKEIKVHAGTGGEGCISFASLFANEFAGPDGGDGGNGGHVLFQSTFEAKSLSHLPSIIKGKNGVKGGTATCHGQNAEHLLIKVPLGTIFKKDTGETVADLNSENAMFVAAKGGAGGKGNKFFATSGNQSPEIAEFGGEGETAAYIVEMATIAHFGLVGYPNAGKSTLLRAISRARPRVADYPFTTLRPYVGMVMYDDMEQIAVADIPGLIEDAHKNRGLGISFLRHIQRCLCLIYVIDFSSERPWDEFETLKSELRHYDPNLCTRPSLIVANKMDLLDAKTNFGDFKDNMNQAGIEMPIYPISAKNGVNLKAFLSQLRTIYDSSVSKREPDIPYNPVRHDSLINGWRRPD